MTFLKLRAKRLAKEQGIPYKKARWQGTDWQDGFKVLGQVVLGIVVAATPVIQQQYKKRGVSTLAL